MWYSITQTTSLFAIPRSFMQTAQGLPDPNHFLVLTPMPGNRYRRSVAVTSAVLVAALLHGGLLFWYVSRPGTAGVFSRSTVADDRHGVVGTAVASGQSTDCTTSATETRRAAQAG
ncbi:hypothetical protein [Methylomonas fluvii]|uniref:Energy transducer TonB n=1 Tax=Methylomonas fluvii TaxID=1854564 RepID=A0ABR9DBC4_9GAMM|nr:hypothetical protein [Methylomonas fluvii]MBD9360410.1 hypothetical protein [Methylomonas fluvii]CAD6873222.1 hypothetical protein [Methylomonas fluvii]